MLFVVWWSDSETQNKLLFVTQNLVDEDCVARFGSRPTRLDFQIKLWFFHRRGLLETCRANKNAMPPWELELISLQIYWVSSHDQRCKIEFPMKIPQLIHFAGNSVAYDSVLREDYLSLRVWAKFSMPLREVSRVFWGHCRKRNSKRGE